LIVIGPSRRNLANMSCAARSLPETDRRTV
jgi:hypothetical protein